MEKETHEGIIGRFILALLIYFSGLFLIFFVIFYGMLGLNYVIWHSFNWNFIYGVPISLSTKNAIEAFIWVLTKFLIVSANIFIIWLTAKKLKIFKPKKEFIEIKEEVTKKKNFFYSYMYGFIGFVFSLVAMTMIVVCYFFIGGFIGLKNMTSGGHWSDDIVVFIMPITYSIATVIIFVLAGVKNGKRIF